MEPNLVSEPELTSESVFTARNIMFLWSIEVFTVADYPKNTNLWFEDTNPQEPPVLATPQP